MQDKNTQQLHAPEAQPESVHVFIYGTLRAGEINDIMLVARRHGLSDPERLGTAAVPGKLHDFGDYPGWVPDSRSANQVTGDIYRIPSALLPVLDEIEEVYPGTPGLFARLTVPVSCVGSTHSCIAYPVEASAAASRPVIESGDWVRYREARATCADPH